MVAYLTPAEVIAKIGNVVASESIDGVLYTLAADAVVRTNDVDTGWIVSRVEYANQNAAIAAFTRAILDANALAARR